MTLPKHIKVGPFDFPVRPISQALGRRLCEDGDFDGDTIHIAAGQRGPALADTVMHELLHAIFKTFALKDEDDEERIVSAIATALTGVFRDNQNFAPWINDEANRTPSK
tara:strand:- start:708 stop:1034 length:327 start_codon:yes stop_codon:yes gene_type:complete